ncbi:MAG TPA: hypothetical protein VJ302_20115, partial [Blastocatellia bacterium]|nr:hypothetical protein [Blastocatellia bacterium]
MMSNKLLPGLVLVLLLVFSIPPALRYRSAGRAQERSDRNREQGLQLRLSEAQATDRPSPTPAATAA